MQDYGKYKHLIHLLKHIHTLKATKALAVRASNLLYDIFNVTIVEMAVEYNVRTIKFERNGSSGHVTSDFLGYTLQKIKAAVNR